MKRPLTLRAAGVLLLALCVLALPREPQAVSHAGVAPSTEDRVLREAMIADERILYVADYDLKDRFDLYSAPLAGGRPTRLSADLPAGNVEHFAAGEAGLVVFAFRCADNGQRLLYSVPVGGGALTALGPSYPDNYKGSQLMFGISPAGNRVVYIADVSKFNAFELFSVSITGGPSVTLNVPLPGLGSSLPGQVTGFSFTPDGAQVVYRALAVVGTANGKLYRVPTVGGPSVLLAEGVDRSNELISPNGAFVVYASTNELRSVALDGASPATLIASSNNIAFAITPDSARIVYTLQGESYETKLYSAPITGGAATVVASDVRYADRFTFTLTPDGTGVLYNDAAFTQLLLAPTLGGAPQTISATQVSPQGAHFSEDGASAIMATSYEDARGIYNHKLSGGAPLRLDSPADSADGALLFKGDLLDGRAIYVAFAGAPESGQRLYSAPLSGGGSTLLAGSLGAGQEQIEVRAAAQGYVLFTSGGHVGFPPTWRYLYVAPVSGAAPARLVHQSVLEQESIFLPLVQR